MKKIISLFQRNYDGDRQVRNEVVPGAEWVVAGEGKATKKIDGTCCLVRDNKLYKRYEVKPDSKAPLEFSPANEVDEVTGKQQGWLPVGEGPEDRWHREAFAELVERDDVCEGKTCELVGPKIQGNPEGYPRHCLVYHDNPFLVLRPEPPRDFEGLKAYLAGQDLEGIVWHRDNGDMVKIKGKDFGLRRKSKR